MMGLAGLRGQSLAGPLLVAGSTISPGLVPLLGPQLRSHAIGVSQSLSSLDAYSADSPITTPMVTVTPKQARRGEAFRFRWAQSSGIPGQALSPDSSTTSFRFSIGSYSSNPQVWRCRVENQYGEYGDTEVVFSVIRYDPGPPTLNGSGSPAGRQIVAINPSTRTATVYFSVSASGGVPPYTYNWGGGDYPTSASNQATIYLPPGAASGIDFNPGCTITDSYPQSIVRGAGPFFIMEA